MPPAMHRVVRSVHVVDEDGKTPDAAVFVGSFFLALLVVSVVCMIWLKLRAVVARKRAKSGLGRVGGRGDVEREGKGRVAYAGQEENSVAS